jgi:hypothetical protein
VFDSSVLDSQLALLKMFDDACNVSALRTDILSMNDIIAALLILVSVLLVTAALTVSFASVLILVAVVLAAAGTGISGVLTALAA